MGALEGVGGGRDGGGGGDGGDGGAGCRVMEVGGVRARQLLEDSVIKLSAHAGYQSANTSAVMLLTDATR